MYHLSVFFAALSLVSAFCDHGSTFNRRQVEPEDILDETFQSSNWSFSGLDGPLAWQGAAEQYKTCATGKNQSPINIISSKMRPAKGGDCMKFEIKGGEAGLENFGKTIEVETEGRLVLNEKEHRLLQFHFHGPGEHHIDNQHWPLEVHFVFQAKDESLAVVGFLIEVGDKRESLNLLDTVFENLDRITQKGSMTKTPPLDFRELEYHLKKSDVFQYSGSLTVPPCIQDVAWNVVSDPIYISIADFRLVKKIMGFNSRFIQNLPGGQNLIEYGCSLL